VTYIADPVSRNQLRHIASWIRETTGFKDTLWFPVIEFLEKVMPMLFSGFHYDIVSNAELGPNKHGETDIVNKCIRIREDVYNGALEGNGRDRMTVAHEIAHYILLVVYGVKFARIFNDVSVITYRDPEWQAKALAGELLCPAHVIFSMTPDEIANECGVSYPAAQYQKKQAGGGAFGKRNRKSIS